MLKIEKEAALASASDKTLVKPRFLRPAHAAKRVDLSRSSIYEILASGKVKSHRIGGARLVCVESLDAFIASQPAA